MTRPKIKLAVIRGEGVRSCPFGLDTIPTVCQYAGNSVDRMMPLDKIEEEEELIKIKKANQVIYAYHKTDMRCKYADEILKNHNKVECDFDDTAAGYKNTTFRGSPLYPQTFHGMGLDGLYGNPLGFYADNDESRNLFLGLFSLLGFSTKEELIKLADTYDVSGDIDKKNIISGLLNRIEKIRKEKTQEFTKIQKYIDEYKSKYNK